MGSSRPFYLSAGWAWLVLAGWLGGCAPVRQKPVPSLAVEILQEGTAVVGQNTLGLSLANPTGRRLSLVARLELLAPSGQRLAREQSVWIPAGAARQLTLEYQASEPGIYSGSLEIYDQARRPQVRAFSDLRVVVWPQWEFTCDRSYYTSEPAIRFRGRLRRGEGEGKRLVVELRDQEGRRAQQAVPFRGPEAIGALDATALPAGCYSLRASLYGPGGPEDSLACQVCKYPGGAREVKVDLFSQTLLVEGRPFFPIGLYWLRAEALAELRRLRFNSGDYFYRLGDEEIAALMEEAARTGVQILLELTPLIRGRPTPDYAAIEALVERYGRHPALLAWYLVDEPADAQVDPGQLRGVYQRLRQLDPYHPVYLVNNRPQAYASYIEASDILAIDVYPVPDHPLTRVRDCLQQARWASQGRKPVWLVAQAFGGVEHWARPPEPAELRNMVYQALVQGAGGVLFYRYCQESERHIQPPALWREVRTLASELEALSPVLATPERTERAEPVGGPQGVEAMIRKYQGAFYLFAVNCRAAAQRVRLRLRGLPPLARVEGLYQSPPPVLQEDLLVVDLAALGVGVYRLEPAGI